MKIKNRIYKSELVEWEKVNDLQPELLKEHYNINHLRKSILKYGVSKAYDICEIDGELYWLDGHTRTEMFRTLQSEGIEIPKMLMANFCEVKNRQEAVSILLEVHNIKHDPINNEVLTEWVNIEQVEVEVHSLNVVDINDIEEETQEILEAEEDDFDSTPPEIPETVLGDLYEIGSHRLLCGDSTCSDTVAKLMNGEKADMVFTDPPYGYKYESNHQSKHKELLNDDVILDFIPNAYLFSKDNTAIYIFCGWQTITDWIGKVKENDLDLKNIIVWKKNNWSMGDLKGAYAGQYEVILFCHKGRVELKNGRGQDVWEFDRVPPTDHPTMKPVELIQKAINDTTNLNELVLDLFLGSGSTMVASHQLKRKCYGMELDPKYCDVIVKRIIKLDSSLKVKRNGKDETKKWLDKIK